MIICEKSAKSESSKAAKQWTVNVQTTPSVPAASPSTPVVGTSLMSCSNADARLSARRILQYLESLKDAEAKREGNKSSFTASGYLIFC
jgi:hypothetical protein